MMGTITKVGIKPGQIRNKEVSIEEAIERHGMVLDMIVDKMHCPPCQMASNHDKTLYNPDTGIATRTAVLEEKAETNQKLIWLFVSGFILSVITLVVTIVVPAALG